jgi:acetyl esterase/lipase
MSIKIFKIIFFVAFQFLLTNVAFSQQATNVPDSLKKYKPVDYPEGFKADIDEVYTKVGDWEGRMDLYYQPSNAKPTPIVINIHGGGWKNGVKESQGGFNSFFRAGISVANIEYRMTNYATAPAAIEDARCALIFLIQNANRFNIDINKIVVMGGSAGGHLALMTGLLANNRIFDKNCKSGKDIKVAAIIDKWGITDVWAWANNDYGPSVRKSKSPTDWLGPKKNDEAFAKMVSPIWYVNKKAPPILIIHGDADSTVPYVQSQELLEKSKSFGVRSELITVTGGGHGKFSKEKNTELSKNIIDFILSLEVFKN